MGVYAGNYKDFLPQTARTKAFYSEALVVLQYNSRWPFVIRSRHWSDYLVFTARKHPMADDQAPKPTAGIVGFDYGAPAELFPSRGWKKRNPVAYKRFDTAAEAIRFAVEEMPPPALLGACIEVSEARFGLREIHDLYESAAYPLKRRAAASLPKRKSFTKKSR
jgi:hypothetical protein